MDVLWSVRDEVALEKELPAVDAEIDAIIIDSPRVSIPLQEAAKKAVDSENAAKNPPDGGDMGMRTTYVYSSGSS
jgi:hypothetical protein